jgi:hypothetical protein
VSFFAVDAPAPAVRIVVVLNTPRFCMMNRFDYNPAATEAMIQLMWGAISPLRIVDRSITRSATGRM